MPDRKSISQSARECKPVEKSEIAETVAKEMRDGGFPQMHRDTYLTGESSEPTLFPQTNAWMAKRTILDVKLRNPGAVVALVGPRGTGKTQMATDAAFAYAMRIRERGMARACRYVRTMEFFMGVKDAYGTTTSERDVFDSFTIPPLLVLDEVQVRNESKWEDNALTYLIDTRYGACRRTILISNQTVEGFTASMGDSIMSRLSETGTIIPCEWQSFRMVKR